MLGNCIENIIPADNIWLSFPVECHTNRSNDRKLVANVANSSMPHAFMTSLLLDGTTVNPCWVYISVHKQI